MCFWPYLFGSHSMISTGEGNCTTDELTSSPKKHAKVCYKVKITDHRWFLWVFYTNNFHTFPGRALLSQCIKCSELCYSDNTKRKLFVELEAIFHYCDVWFFSHEICSFPSTVLLMFHCFPSTVRTIAFFRHIAIYFSRNHLSSIPCNIHLSWAQLDTPTLAQLSLCKLSQ